METKCGKIKRTKNKIIINICQEKNKRRKNIK